MAEIEKDRNIHNRRELFDFLQTQMQAAYRELQESQRLESESTLVKSYILEIDLPDDLRRSELCSGTLWENFIQRLFSPRFSEQANVTVNSKDEEGFFEVTLSRGRTRAIVYLDTLTDRRFWLAFSISKTPLLDRWLHSAVMNNPQIDFVWFWPRFLENIQRRGEPRGFGLDYDYRKFQKKLQFENDEDTSYLKMQIWGGRKTAHLYELLRKDSSLGDKVVLSKVRFKEWANDSSDSFALQDVKYNGKFTARGTDLSTHLSALTDIRRKYREKIESIEDKCRLRWSKSKANGLKLSGSAIYFIPQGFQLPVHQFCNVVLDGTLPFRLLGFITHASHDSAAAQVVDLHTGGELSFEIYPDMLVVYLQQGTCGNTLVRLYTNLQHYYRSSFEVLTDDEEGLF